MLNTLRALLTKWFQPPPTIAEAEPASTPQPIPKFLRAHHDGADYPAEAESQTVTAHLVHYDENLLERARTQWQFGDWQTLAQIARDTLQHHPDRAKLALLAAAGRLQTGQDAEARQYIRLAQDWGVGKKLITQILIAGVHNSLGRAAAIGNQQHRALQHFESAIATGTPGSDRRLLTQARINEQHAQLGLAPLAIGTNPPAPAIAANPH